jgi:serine/threonine protein kinase
MTFLPNRPEEHVGPSSAEHANGSYGGRIYKAREKETRKRVTLKELISLTAPANHGFVMCQFLIPMAMTIPSVVKILGYCPLASHEQAGVIVIELMKNGTLDDALRARPKRRFGPTELSKPIFGVAAAMEIAHRDLNPGNVLLDENLEPHWPGLRL